MTRRTRSEIQTIINSTINTNGAGEIDALDVRSVLTDILDSSPASGEVPLFLNTPARSGVVFIDTEGNFNTSSSFFYQSGVARLGLTSGITTVASGDLLDVRGRSRLDATYSLPIGNNVLAGVASVNIDLAFSNHHELALNSNKTISFMNGKPGQRFILRVTQGGSYTITWPTVSWSSQIAPTLSSSGFSDVFGFLITSSGSVDGFVIGQGH